MVTYIGTGCSYAAADNGFSDLLFCVVFSHMMSEFSSVSR